MKAARDNNEVLLNESYLETVQLFISTILVISKSRQYSLLHCQRAYGNTSEMFSEESVIFGGKQ